MSTSLIVLPKVQCSKHRDTSNALSHSGQNSIRNVKHHDEITKVTFGQCLNIDNTMKKNINVSPVMALLQISTYNSFLKYMSFQYVYQILGANN